MMCHWWYSSSGVRPWTDFPPELNWVLVGLRDHMGVLGLVAENALWVGDHLSVSLAGQKESHDMVFLPCEGVR